MKKLGATGAFLICLCLVGPSFEDSKTLLQVSALFRHGNRVTEESFFYPNAPYNISMFHPYDYGDLTLKGQKTEFKKGLEFRRRFNKFLGDCYFTNLVQSGSSGFSRCEMSLQAIHTAIFGRSKCEPLWDLPWQAVPYTINSTNSDNTKLLTLVCPDLIEDVDDPSIIDEDTVRVFAAVRKYSGFTDPIDNLDAVKVYDYIKTSVDFGYEVPKDFADVYPQPLRKVAMNFYYNLSKNYQASIGYFLKSVTDVAFAKANNEVPPEDLKLHLYAAHDFDIYLLLHALNVFPAPEEMHYGAYVFFELHKIDGVYGFKVYLQNDYWRPKLLDIPQCGTFCSLSWYTDLANYLLDNILDCAK